MVVMNSLVPLIIENFMISWIIK